VWWLIIKPRSGQGRAKEFFFGPGQTELPALPSFAGAAQMAECRSKEFRLLKAFDAQFEKSAL
jgi:hypothetical protein